MTTSISPFWLSDPAWLSMDATSRGFHTQLLLVAARRKPAGTLPNDETHIRKWLGLPTKPVSPKNKKPWAKITQNEVASLLVGLLDQDPGTTSEMETDPDSVALWLWENHWKPIVMSAWQPIDEELIEQYPHLSKLLGGWFNSLAYSLADAGAVVAEKTQTPSKPTKKKPLKVASLLWGEQLDITGQAANQGLEHGGFTIVSLMDKTEVLARWRPEMEEASRKSMWDVGVDCLAGVGATASEKGKARGLLGKHIKQYGEDAVAKAVGSMAMRSIPPADAVAFLTGMLRQETEGSPAERAAREKRSNLCL